MLLEKTVGLYKEVLKQQQELRRVGLLLEGGKQESDEIKEVLEKAYFEEADRFEKVKIKQRIEEVSSKGAGLSDHSKEVLGSNDIKSTVLEMKDNYLAEYPKAEARHKELVSELNKKITAKSKELELYLKEFEEELKPITEEIDQLYRYDNVLISTSGRRKNAIEWMNEFGDNRIDRSVAPQFGFDKSIRKLLISKVVTLKGRDVWTYFKGGSF